MRNEPYPYYPVGEYDTLNGFLDCTCHKYEKNIAFKYTRNKEDVEKTYGEFYNDCEALAKVLTSLGFSGQNIGVLGENSYEWVLSYLATTISGNTIVPIDKDLSYEEVLNIVTNSKQKVLFCSKTYDDYAEKIVSDVPNIKVIDFEAINDLIDKKMESQLILNENMSDTVAAIIYTSGTTGAPKGVMLTHGQLCADVRASVMQIKMTGDSLLLLPLHHTFILTCNILYALNFGYAICIPSSMKHTEADLKKYKPSTLFLVPLIIESFHKKIWKNAKSRNRALFLKLLMLLSNFLLYFKIDVRNTFFRDIKSSFGGNLDLIIAGGATLEKEYVKEFRTFGINISNGYGITECSPVVSVNRNEYFKDGSIGTPLPGVEVKIDKKNENDLEGEILVKGNIVMKGYYMNQQMTDESMSGKYFRTGDVGYIDNDGFIFITGRKKNIIILDNGKNVYPEELEGKIQLKQGVKEVLVYNRGNRIIAEIFPDYGAIPTNISVNDFFDKLISDFNKSLPYYKKIHEFKIRTMEFEKTTSKKIKRRYYDA